MEFDYSENKIHILLESIDSFGNYIELLKIDTLGIIIDSIIIEFPQQILSLDNSSEIFIGEESLYFYGDYFSSNHKQFFLEINLDYNSYQISDLNESNNFIHNKGITTICTNGTKYLVGQRQKENFEIITNIKKLDTNNSVVWEIDIDDPGMKDNLFSSAHLEDGLIKVGQNISSISFTNDPSIVNKIFTFDENGFATDEEIPLNPQEFLKSNILSYTYNNSVKYLVGVNEFDPNPILSFPNLPKITVFDSNWNWIQEIELGDQNYNLNGVNQVMSKNNVFLTGQKLDDESLRVLPFICKLDESLDTTWCHNYIINPFVDSFDRVNLSGSATLNSGSIIIAGNYNDLNINSSNDRPFVFKTNERGCLQNDCPDIISKTINIEEKNFMEIYPNPANDRIAIQDEKEFDSFVIYDVSGRKILNGTLNQDKTIIIKNLTNGLYNLVISNFNTSESKYGKFIKNN